MIIASLQNLKPDPCPLCGANINLVGRAHNCTQRIAAAPLGCVANNDVANAAADVVNMANASKAPGRNRASLTYRYRNPDTRRLYMRDLMRRKRAAQRKRAA